jgi:hypothetical protein
MVTYLVSDLPHAFIGRRESDRDAINSHVPSDVIIWSPAAGLRFKSMLLRGLFSHRQASLAYLSGRRCASSTTYRRAGSTGTLGRETWARPQ